MNSNKSLVSIIILNLNGLKDTVKCLQSVTKTRYLNYEIIIVDNGSKQNQAEKIQKYKFRKTKVYRTENNLGFTGGNNWALKKTKGKYVVLLNNDTVVNPNWLSPLVDLMESDKKIAVAQPKILSMRQKTYFDYAGATGGYIDKYGYPFTRGRIFNALEKDRGQYNGTTRIFWASGSVCIIRKSVIKKVGGLFSENLFNYMEEIDFCWRVWNRGYKVMFTSDSVVYHKVAGTAGKDLIKKRFWEHRNNLFILTRNLDRKSLTKILIPRFFLEIIAYFGYLFRGEKKYAFSLMLAHLDYARKFILIRYKRGRLPNRDNLPVYQGSIVFDYFIRKISKFSDLKWSPKGNVTFLVLNTKESGGYMQIQKHAKELIGKGYFVNMYQILGKPSTANNNLKTQSFIKSFFHTTPDVLIATFWPTAYVSLFMKGKNKYYFVRGWEKQFHNNFVLKFFAEKSLTLPFTVITTTNFLRKKIRRYKKTNTPVTKIPNSINTAIFKSSYVVKKRKKEINILSVISWYHHPKGPDLLEKAVIKLKAKHNNYRFTLVSKEKSVYSSVFDKFISDPDIERLAKLYRNSDFLLSTSRVEGFFTPGLEAMSSGCIFVSTNSGGVLEYAKNNHNSIILNKLSDLWEKNVINKILTNRKTMQKLISNGHKTAQQFSDQNSANRLEKVIFRNY